MKVLLSDATADGAGEVINRTGPYVLAGLFRWRKTGDGTCTLTLKDNNGATLASVEVDATDPLAGYEEVPIPSSYYVEISSTAGSVSVSAWMDGDA